MKIKFKINILLILLIIFILFFINLNFSFGKEEIFTGEINFSNLISKNVNIKEYIKNFYQIAINVSVFLAILMIVIGGIYYSISGAIDKKNEAKEMILSAVFGLILILSVNLILTIINPSLAKLDLFDIEPVPSIPSIPVENQNNDNKGFLLINSFSSSTANEMQKLADDIIKNQNNNFEIRKTGDCLLLPSNDFLNVYKKYANPRFSFYSSQNTSTVKYEVTPYTTLASIKDGYLPPICNSGCTNLQSCSTRYKKSLTLTTLKILKEISESAKILRDYKVTITSLTGGSHGSRSPHYEGRGIDLVINNSNVRNWDDFLFKIKNIFFNKNINNSSQIFCEGTAIIKINKVKISCNYASIKTSTEKLNLTTSINLYATSTCDDLFSPKINIFDRKISIKGANNNEINEKIKTLIKKRERELGLEVFIGINCARGELGIYNYDIYIDDVKDIELNEIKNKHIHITVPPHPSELFY